MTVRSRSTLEDHSTPRPQRARVETTGVDFTKYSLRDPIRTYFSNREVRHIFGTCFPSNRTVIDKLEHLFALYFGESLPADFTPRVLESPALVASVLEDSLKERFDRELTQVLERFPDTITAPVLAALPRDGSIDEVETLDLSGLGISKLPESLLLKCRNLRTLNLSNNGIVSLPDWLIDLPHIQSIDLTNNTISLLPKELVSLTKLQELKLQNTTLDVGKLFMQVIAKGTQSEDHLTLPKLISVINPGETAAKLPIDYIWSALCATHPFFWGQRPARKLTLRHIRNLVISNKENWERPLPPMLRIIHPTGITNRSNTCQTNVFLQAVVLLDIPSTDPAVVRLKQLYSYASASDLRVPDEVARFWRRHLDDKNKGAKWLPYGSTSTVHNALRKKTDLSKFLILSSDEICSSRDRYESVGNFHYTPTHVYAVLKVSDRWFLCNDHIVEDVTDHSDVTDPVLYQIYKRRPSLLGRGRR